MAKKGITMVALVIYMLVFSLITLLLSMIFTNMNKNLFANRGAAINYTTLNKLQYNITESALISSNVTVDGNRIIYSNGDVYEYVSDKNIILLNRGVLCKNVSEFSVKQVTSNNTKKVEISITLNKYLNSLSRNIISSVEVK